MGKRIRKYPLFIAPYLESNMSGKAGSRTVQKFRKQGPDEHGAGRASLALMPVSFSRLSGELLGAAVKALKAQRNQWKANLNAFS